MDPTLRIERFTVNPRYVVATTAVRDRGVLHVTEGMADEALGLFPTLGAQACVSKHHTTFDEELIGTETPHLAEHIALELMMLSAPGEGRLYRGMTRFLGVGVHDRPAADGVIRMETSLSYDDDLIALKAFSQSVRLVAELASGEGSPMATGEEIERMVEDLRTLRTLDSSRNASEGVR